FIVAPYITAAGIKFVLQALGQATQHTNVTVTLVTDLSAKAACEGSTDPSSIRDAWEALGGPIVWHLTKLHAKVYAADHKYAIVTSGNLTTGGLFHNYELGSKISSPELVRTVVSKASALAELGAPVTYSALSQYCNAIAEA